MKCDEQQTSERDCEVLTATTASNSLFLPPAPAKFHRKAKCGGRAASVDAMKITYKSTDSQRKSTYLAHRQYVQTLIIDSETFDDSSSADLWAACEDLF
jgi:hypothetical protein